MSLLPRRIHPDDERYERVISATEVNFVAAAARAWAGGDLWERWVNDAEGRTSLEETIREYLAGHDPFPADSAVEVRWGGGWEPAVVVERTGLDEWLVETTDGAQAWRDHHELRPRPAGGGARR